MLCNEWLGFEVLKDQRVNEVRPGENSNFLPEKISFSIFSTKNKEIPELVEKTPPAKEDPPESDSLPDYSNKPLSSILDIRKLILSQIQSNASLSDLMAILQE